jgi:hypothetical protein
MSTVYQIVLVQEDECPNSATLHEAPFTTPDGDAAKRFADAFNERELADPLGLWAIVKRQEEE